MVKLTVVAIVFSCLACSFATNYPPKGPAHGPRYGPPKGSPLAEEEPIILHTNRPLLITKTIRELPPEALKQLNHVGRTHSKLLKVHEIRDLEYGNGKILDAHGHFDHGHPRFVGFPLAFHITPKKSLLTEPIVLDHGHRSLHGLRHDILHEDRFFGFHELPHEVFAHGLPAKTLFHSGAHFHGGLSHGLTGLSYSAPIILQEKSLFRPILAPARPVPAPHPEPVKYIKPGY